MLAFVILAVAIYAAVELSKARAENAAASSRASALEARIEVLQQQLAAATVQVQALQAGHPPVMAQALANAPTIFEQARNQERVMREVEQRLKEQEPEHE